MGCPQSSHGIDTCIDACSQEVYHVWNDTQYDNGLRIKGQHKQPEDRISPRRRHKHESH